MSYDLTETTLTKTNRGRAPEVNPWVDILSPLEQGKAFQFTVKNTDDAHTQANALKRAATTLGIGVTIQNVRDAKDNVVAVKFTTRPARTRTAKPTDA